MIKRFSGLIMLVIMLMCSVILSVTYSKFLLSKEIDATINVPEVDYCVRNNITTLAECMLVMENYSSDANSAKLYISSKTPDLTSPAPVVKYAEKNTLVVNESGIINTTQIFSFSSSYSFDSVTGQFHLGSDYVTTEMSDDYIGYYTCGNTNTEWTTCSTMYKVVAYKKMVSASGSLTTRLTSANVYTYSVVDSFDSDIGLYAADDEDGTSFYYRGNVKNNYVSYAGYKWRIVRQNGDGSIRLIYADDSVREDLSVGSVQYNNSIVYDPTHIGYMHNNDFVLNETDTRSITYHGVSINQTYVWGSGYTFDIATGKFTLNDTIIVNWKDNYQNLIKNYPYTCFDYNSSNKCNYVVKADTYIGEGKLSGTVISYGSKSYESSLQNNDDSYIKNIIDSWYKNNILNLKDQKGNLYTDYLADSYFCNDRNKVSGDGFSMKSWTLYSSRNRLLLNTTPTLKCDMNAFSPIDKFTVGNTGNGDLTYPVGLLSADEGALAGGKSNYVNIKYYLYSGSWFWLMTPVQYNTNWLVFQNWYIDKDGGLNYTNAGYAKGVRPVVNLRADIKITGGDGTAENPYVVSL